MRTETRLWWSDYLHPRFWPTWLMFFALWIITRLPYRWQMHSGRLLGRIAWRLARRRRHIAEVNIRLCFPDLDSRRQAALVKAHFVSLGLGIVETALCWWGREAQLRDKRILTGEENLIAAHRLGKGVILLSAHFTTLELGGRLLTLSRPFHVLYRPHKNRLFEAVMQRARARRFGTAIARDDTRTLLKSLRENRAVWYAPDQNHGTGQSVFAPFFGIQASTLTTTSRLAKISGAPVVPFLQVRLEGERGYLLIVCPALENFPTDDPQTDAARINRFIESAVREVPEQYLWVHRRFKTRPEGEPYPY